MVKKLTITLDEAVYSGLHNVIGRRKISHFIADLVRPDVLRKDLDKAYEQMGQDEVRGKDAADWCEGLTGGAAHESW